MVSIKLLLITAATFVATISAHPLWRRSDSVSASATRDGLATGTCWWRFHKANVIDQAHCAVEDLSGNSHSVYAQILYADPVGLTKSFARWDNKNGHGTGMSYDTTFHSTGTTQFDAWNARVQVCDDGPIDRCAISNIIANPH